MTSKKDAEASLNSHLVHLLQVYYKHFAKKSNSVHKLLLALKEAKPRSERDDPDPRKRAIRLREEEIDRLVTR